MIKAKSFVTFLLALVAGAYLVTFLVRYYGYSSCRVIGESMAPTYHSGNLVMMSGYALRNGELRRGDVVVFKDPDGIVVIKRIARVPGEVDDVSPTQGWKILGRNQYVVLGDNTTNSVDSRVYGPVHKEQMLGIVK